MLKILSVLLLLVGLKHVTCLLVSSKTLPECRPLVAPTDGSVSCTDGNNIGSVCKFACDEGYKMLGKRTSRCFGIRSKGKRRPRTLVAARWRSRAPRCRSSGRSIQSNGITYKLVKTSVKGNFEDCQNLCAQQGGTLAQHSLALAYKDAMVAIAGVEPTWIGVSNDNSQNEWRYTSIDGGQEPFPIKDTSSLVAKWAVDQPGTEHQLCATIFKLNHGIEFSTLTCKPATSKLLYGICEHP